MTLLNATVWGFVTVDKYPSSVTLNDRLYNDLMFMIKSTAKIPKRESGGYLIKNLAGKLGIIAETTGETKEVHIEKTEGLNSGERYMGTVHVHTHKPWPSIHDIGTFLKGKEKVMIVASFDGTLNALVKLPNTVEYGDVEQFKQQYPKDTDRTQLADTFGYLHYVGDVNIGKSLNVTNKKLNAQGEAISLDDLMADVPGEDQLPSIPVKKEKRKYKW